MNLEEWFKRGMSAQTYVDHMQTHQKDFIYIYENFPIPVEDHPLFEKIQQKQLRAIVLTEDWCGDAMLNLPIFIKIAEYSRIPVHFLLRDENPELMDRYLTDGRSRAIPKIIFINTEGKEVGTWGPRAPDIQAFIDDSLANLPDQDEEEYNEKRREVLTFITKAYRDNRDFWYCVYDDLKEKIS